MFLKTFYNDKLSRSFNNLSPEGEVSDKLFFLMFYICIGLLPPIITFGDKQFLQLPFFIINVFVLLRIAMRSDFRNRIAVFFLNKKIIFLGSILAIVVALYAVVEILFNNAKLSLLAKPFFLIMGLIMIGFSATSKDQINQKTLAFFAVIGCLLSLFILLSFITWNNYIVGWLPLKQMAGHLAVVSFNHELSGYLTKVLVQNRVLEILSVLLFFIALVFSNSAKAFIFAFIVGILAWLISFQVFGSFHSQNIFDAFYIPSETVQYGLVVSILVLIATRWQPKILTNLFFSSLITLLLCAPLLYQVLYFMVKGLALPHTLMTRTEIWDAVGRKIMDAPFFGHGINSLKYQDILSLDHTYLHKNIVLVHPHNMVLQLWLDLGFVGVSLFAAIVYLGWQQMNKTSLKGRPPLIAGLTMLTIFSLVTHSLWSTWATSLFFIVLIFITLSPILESEQ